MFSSKMLTSILGWSKRSLMIKIFLLLIAICNGVLLNNIIGISLKQNYFLTSFKKKNSSNRINKLLFLNFIKINDFFNVIKKTFVVTK